MKKTLLMISVVVASALTMYGQGRVAFNNITSGNLITVGAQNQGVDGGAAGAVLGGDYSIQLLWAPQAVYANQAAFDAAVVGSSAAFQFIGTTGNAGSAAGYFDGGSVPNPVGTSMPAGAYTMQARAWFNTGFATYAAAAGAGKNVGSSVMFNLSATASPSTPPNTVFSSFTVGTVIVPEPSTFALAGLGAAALLLFRRRK